MAGVAALVDDEFYVVGRESLFALDLTTWGWLHLIVGVVLIASPTGIYAAATWARVVGVIRATLAAIVAFAWVPLYPIWALLLVAASVAVVWALTARGRSHHARHVKRRGPSHDRPPTLTGGRGTPVVRSDLGWPPRSSPLCSPG